MPSTPVAYDPSFEVIADDEDHTQAEIVKTLLSISDTTYKDTNQALRAVHAKSHALLRGELQVMAVAPDYAQGMLAQPRAYPVLIRISTSPGDLLDDAVSTPRGFAMKVIGVEGERLQGSTTSSASATTQDFLMVDGPAFLAPNAKKFLGSLKLLAGTTDKIPNLKRAFSAVLQGAERLVEAAGGESGTLKGLGGHRESNPLGETYFSQTPFLHGPSMAKWSVVPALPEMAALKDAPVDLSDKPDGIREAMLSHFATRGAAWDLRVQLCTDLEKMPIEDASVVWPEDESPFIVVGRITVLAQPAWSEERSSEFDDGLAFSPWHGLAAHRPLGSINRARKPAYDASAETRSPRGRCPVHEPSAATG